MLVEFQYTTCLLATAAEMMLKRKIVALQVGRAPRSVIMREPILRVVVLVAVVRGPRRLCTGREGGREW